jgi:predicted aldo/keto reductase-like oxidoreductase
MYKKGQVNRRGFLKSSLLGSAGALISTTSLAKQPHSKDIEPVIIRRKLGKTGIEIPVVSFGVMRSDNPSLVKAALQKGFVHFDTAHGYQEGRNETMLGELFKEVPRDSFILATKVAPDDMNRETGELGPGATRENILTKFDLSLKRLQMKYVDILYFHGVSNPKTAMEPQMLEAFTELKKQGKVRFVGMSTHKNEPDIIQAAIDSNFYDVVLTTINFTQGHADKTREKIALAAEKGIGIVAMKTMAGGFSDKDRKHPINCVAALKWVMQDKNICTAIPGIVTFDMMVQNFSVMENLEMTEQEKADLEASKLLAGLYCDGCGQCLPLCKKHLPVNELMRAFMYTYGYRQAEKASVLLDEMAVKANPCGGCSGCEVQCVKGFPVQERIADVSRLVGVPRDLIALL